MPTSSFSGSSKRGRGGFTLLEIVVVIAIITALSSMLLGYSQRNSQQIRLATSQARLANIISRAKALSIQTFFQAQTEEEVICAYGVRFDTDEQKVFIFKDVDTPGSDGSRCSREVGDYGYNGTQDVALTGELNELFLKDSGIEMLSDGGYVIFIPPEPLVSFGDNDPSELSVTLKDEIINLRVIVSENGQVRLE